MKNYYKILNLEFTNDTQIIKKSYRKLALKYHPDVNKEVDASDKFIEITEAYEVLNNPSKKNEYDIYYSDWIMKSSYNAQEKNEFIKKSKMQEWSQYGNRKAEEYKKMSYNDFIDNIIDELKIGISYVPNLIFILICGFGAISSFYVMADINFLFGIIIFLIYSTLTYFLYERAKNDYIAERRYKILKKYK